MSQHRSLVIPKQWLKDLAVRIATRTLDREAVKRIQTGVALIATGLPDAAFCSDSADHVINSSTAEPGASQIRSLVQEWWTANAPEDPKGMPRDIADSGLDLTDQQWCRMFRRSSVMFAANTLHLIKMQSAAAFRWLVENDTDAFRLARQRGWSVSSETGRASEWGDPVVVRRAVDACYGILEDGGQTWPSDHDVASALSLLSALVGRWAPQNLSLIPSVAAVPPARPDPRDAVSSRPVPSTMSADRLAAVYEARGLRDPRRAEAA